MSFIDVFLILLLCGAVAVALYFIVKNKGKCASCKNCDFNCNKKQ